MLTSQNICAYQNIRFQSRYMRTSWNICAYPTYLLPCKIFAPSKYSLTSKIFTPYLKYLSIYKIYAPQQECSHLIIYDSNKAAVEIFAPYERCMRPENRRPNSYYLGSAESPTSDSFSVWLKSSRSGDVVSPPCSPQVGICSQTAQLIWAASLQYCTGCCTGTTCQNVRALSKCSWPRIFPTFSGKNQKPNSAHKCPITSVQIRTQSQKLSEFSCNTPK